MGGSTYKHDYRGFGDSVLRAAFMVAEMERRGSRVLSEAIATAPVYEGPDDAHRGRYKASFAMTSTDHGGWKGNRAAAVISNSAPEAVFVEFGVRPHGHERGQGARHTLIRALRAAGD